MSASSHPVDAGPDEPKRRMQGGTSAIRTPACPACGELAAFVTRSEQKCGTSAQLKFPMPVAPERHVLLVFTCALCHASVRLSSMTRAARQS